MRWPGTIQPSRFLSHTGQVLPGVRRIVNVKNPAAGADWSVTVPAGVQWKVIGGAANFTTSATVDSRHPFMIVKWDGYRLSTAGTVVSIAASSGLTLGITSDPAVAYAIGVAQEVGLTLPNLYFPDGTTIGTNTASLQAGDQWSSIALWVEEVYVTDAQLSEDARLHAELERDIAIYEYQQAEQAAEGT